MSFCSCCCHCLDWCVDTCCPRLRGQEKAPYPRIQYSQVSVDDQSTVVPDEGWHGSTRITEGRRRYRRCQSAELLESQHIDAPPRPPKMRFALPQAGSASAFSIHPQLGVSIPNSRVLTEQPSPSPDYFKERFDLSTELEESPELADRSRPSSNASSTGDLPGVVSQRVQYTVPGLPVYREKAVSPLASSVTSSRKQSDPDYQDAIVQFSLHYDIQQSKLRVYLQYATKLPKALYKGSLVQCDPFVMVHLEPDREDTFQSTIVKCTYDPVFNQTFQFGGLSVDNVRLQTLVFRFYNHALNNRAIGKASLKLRDVDLFGVVVQMKIIGSEEMEGNFQGDLLLSLSYSPVSRKLAGIISKATGLRKHDMFGKADPYVKVVVSYNEMVVYKWKTSIRYKTLAPVYNESFNCKVSEEMSEAMDKLTISFYVIDYDYVLRNDTMGVVNIGKNVDTKLGRKHWHQVLQSPRQGISFWHPIQLATTAQKRYMRSRSPSPLPQ